ncbi:hypothetical protein RB608_21105 [Nocardioides sp. LHD-245]|uniref:hypothetical protein n=1 Tax=Nocardioides sp. LHD-245 TaxID=3051387 RepID=UPI0027E0C4BC|nr:hypothetical protein [Nocardioides sp. LHD-245]
MVATIALGLAACGDDEPAGRPSAGETDDVPGDELPGMMSAARMAVLEEPADTDFPVSG